MQVNIPTGCVILDLYKYTQLDSNRKLLETERLYLGYDYIVAELLKEIQKNDAILSKVVDKINNGNTGITAISKEAIKRLFPEIIKSALNNY